MESRLQPALFGGLFIGVLSALPFINAANCCCCLWVVAGGVLAAYLRQQNSPYAIPASEGALVGLMAGFVGGIVFIIVSIPMEALTGPMQQRFIEGMMSANPDIPPELRDMMERASTGTALRAASFVFTIIVDVIFGMLGGLLGVAMFKKNAPPPPPAGTIDVLPPE
jgi:hypothetical protein